MALTSFPPSNPDIGTLWFSPDTNQFYMFNGEKWIRTRLDELMQRSPAY